MEKTILITGGVKRLGLEFARTSLKMGYTVILHYHTEISGETSKLSQFEKEKRVFYIQHNLDENPEGLIKKAISIKPDIIGLVNNASSFTMGNLLEPTHFDHTLMINALAPIRLSSAFKETVGKGWIINITDANIHHPNRSYQNYRISKLLLEEITRQQAFLFAPDIRVNAIAPGAMLPSKGKENYFETLKEKIPLQSTGNISALTDAYSFLIENEYLTGQILRVDGGWSLI